MKNATDSYVCGSLLHVDEVMLIMKLKKDTIQLNYIFQFLLFSLVWKSALVQWWSAVSKRMVKNKVLELYGKIL